MMTIDLYNIDVDKLKRNPNMKPKRNPLHLDFLDDSNSIFDKFGFDKGHNLLNGGHNKIYKNDNFTLRISRMRFQLPNEKFDYDKHLNIGQTMKDEMILKKALKNKLSPNVYLFSNIKMDEYIYRYSIMESYTTCLSKFIKFRQVSKSLNVEHSLYQNATSVYEDIASQIVGICQKIINMGIVYYDFKSDNIVLNIDSETGKVDVNMIDWDSQFCVEESFLKDNKEAILFLNLCICGYYMYTYCRLNILCHEIKKLYNSEIIDKVIYLIFELDNEYITIILHYFYISFDMKYTEKQRFNIDDLDQREYLKRKIIENLINCACYIN